MTAIHPISLATWNGTLPAAEQGVATDALEAGHVLFMPELRFELSEAERAYLNPALVGKSKNVSYDPRSGKLGGLNVATMKLDDLRALMDRFATSARTSRDLAPDLRRRTSSGEDEPAPGRGRGALSRGGRTTRGCTWTVSRASLRAGIASCGCLAT